ncbi:MAG: hypothetical protein AB1609_08145 [Bacillota bacterium]
MLRKWSWLLAAALLVLASSVALAYNPNGEALPANASETPVYELTNQGWQAVTSPDGDVLARSWNSGPTFGFCNKAYWDFTFTTHASVAQWVNWTVGTTRKDWRIRKPGTYASDSIHFSLASNNDVVLSFYGFDNLHYLNPDAPSPDSEIETYYSFGETIGEAESNGWIAAPALNDMVITFPDSEALHQGIQYKLWQKLEVSNSNSSSEWENVGTVRIAITNLKFWVDGNTGHFAEDQFGEPPTEPYDPSTI